MLSLLNNRTMHWRVRMIDRIIKRWVWDVKRALDFSAKEKVENISMIVVGRNDNYGGDFTERLKATIDWNYNHIPNVELIYVEWNRMADRPSDTEWIAQRYPNSKCFIVPTEIHEQITTNPKMPMMEYYAKNLGIREASHDWVMMINADVFLAPDAIAKMGRLSRKHIYGTHYKNLIWKGEPITESLFNDKRKIKNLFSTNWDLEAVVGNFILTHKDNWMQATGYDETLNDIRLGVDDNGRKQLLHAGLKPMVIGTHYHLDHNESAINSRNNPTHGNALRIAQALNIPYKNNPDWGFAAYPRKQVAERVWQLERL